MIFDAISNFICYEGRLIKSVVSANHTFIFDSNNIFGFNHAFVVYLNRLTLIGASCDHYNTNY